MGRKKQTKEEGMYIKPMAAELGHLLCGTQPFMKRKKEGAAARLSGTGWAHHLCSGGDCANSYVGVHHADMI